MEPKNVHDAVRWLTLYLAELERTAHGNEQLEVINEAQKVIDWLRSVVR